MQINDYIQLILGVWGTVLSTWVYFRVRSSVKVTVQSNMMVVSEYGGVSNERLTIIKAVNVGKRPITITNGYIYFPKKSNLYPCVTAKDAIKNQYIQEGEFITMQFEEKTFDTKRFVALVCDASGKKYWSHNKLQRLFILRKF